MRSLPMFASGALRPMALGPVPGARRPAALPSTAMGMHARPAGGLRTIDLRNLPIVLVLALATTGICYSAAVPPHWLRGVLLLAAALVLASLFRLVLPARQAGLLAVRGRVVDILWYAGLGVAIITFGLTLPH